MKSIFILLFVSLFLSANQIEPNYVLIAKVSDPEKYNLEITYTELLKKNVIYGKTLWKAANGDCYIVSGKEKNIIISAHNLIDIITIEKSIDN